MFFELILVGAGGFAIHKWMKSSEKPKKVSKKYEEINLNIDLEIKNNDDYLKAIKKIRELEKYLAVVSNDTRSDLVYAINQLQSSIDSYKNEPEVNNNSKYFEAVSSFETSFTSGKFNRYYIQTYKDVYDQFGFKYNLRIKYTDSDGKSTQRDISVNSIEMYDGDGSIHAYCHLRKYQRTFKMDRVAECIDPETGEFINDIYKYLKDKYSTSAEKSLSDFIEKNGDVLEILFYVGKADTQLKKEERAIICETVRRIANDDRISDDMVNDIMNEMYPYSERTFKVKIGKMVEYSTDLKQDVFDTMSAIVHTQKTIHPAEQTALDYTSKKWGL